MGTMLVSLSIRDFVLIDRLDLEPDSGFTALTGETGAGKSIILDALGLALGAAAEKRHVRAGAGQASVLAEFAPAPDHPVWAMLESEGVAADAGETLTLKRLVPRDGPSRALINGEAVSAALLGRIGASLVEIHGQHAAAALWRPSTHRVMLDNYAGNQDLLLKTAELWKQLAEARETRQRLSEGARDATALRESLDGDIERLQQLSPRVGEAATLTDLRQRLMQAERAGEAVRLAREVLEGGDVASGLAAATRELERVSQMKGFEREDDPMGALARAAGGALERALIEIQEAEQAIGQLEAGCESDPDGLEATEARLFALRAEARRHEVEPDQLPEVLETCLERRESLVSNEDALEAAGEAERAAAAAWRAAADRLTRARKAAGERLAVAVAAELAPLRLAKVDLRFAITTLPDAEIGPCGQDHVEIEVETNSGAGFGPLRKIASGGELTRISLALRCALAETGASGVLVFDEADQGVGGSVAAAMGERFARLATGRQVFAVTHSPQVAAAAAAQWRISKSDGEGVGRTQVSSLDEAHRCEEIARMLAGHEITQEARAAARRLLEERCRSQSPSAN